MRSSVEPLPLDDGRLFLVRAGEDDLAIRDAEPADRELLELLAAGARSEDELAAALPVDRATLRDKLTALDRAGVLASEAGTPLDPVDAERYARQLPYLAELGDAHDLQRRLRAAHVVTLGCGGLGTWTIAALASAGVGRFTVVDDDAVELSNLNRQILYRAADLGTAKADATAAWLAAFDARIRVVAHRRRIDGPGALGALLGDADLVLLAADQPPYEIARWTSDACVAAGVPFVTAGQLPPVLKIGPLYVPGETGCFRCHEQALRGGDAAYDGYVARMRSAPARGATLGPTSGIVGAMLAMELVHFLCGRAPGILGAALIVDIRDHAIRHEKIARDPACPICKTRSRPSR